MPNKKKQIKIGLTGGIGSGKTFVGTIFRKLGFPVFDADIEAKKCLVENEILKQKIKDIFGNKIYINGLLQNKMLAKIVFNDAQKLEELNQLVHPLVKQIFEFWCLDHDSQIVIKEAAILFESNSHLSLDKVICVTASEEARIERVIKRDNISREQVVDRIERQMLQYEKMKLSDFIIINDNEELLMPQILRIITQIS